ncbi:MAG: ArsR family transcriptional regulator [Bacteriovoracaceae bacterium]|jgi:DNA-binding transcriptional regulator GbsR (MarR family)|nr:ArsR family transcriptional regulator [Bacteriovoracaceae bacterium]
MKVNEDNKTSISSAETTARNIQSGMPVGITDDVLKELHHFENFFDRIGFKRIDGAVFGLLTLSCEPLSSEEIQLILNLSQSAVSQSLKNLNQFGAIETRDSRDRKLKVHLAKADSLQIVASVFRKREQEMVHEFKRMAQRILEIDQKENPVDIAKNPESNLRRIRMKSIIKTCEMAEATMNFVIALTQLKNKDDYQKITEKFPKALEFLLEIQERSSDLREVMLTEDIKEKIKLGTSTLVSTLGKRIKNQGKIL